MSIFCKSVVEAKVQSCIDALTANTSSDELLQLAFSMCNLTDRKSCVADVASLPTIDGSQAFLGREIWVDSEKAPLIAGTHAWLRSDGAIARRDMCYVELWAWGRDYGAVGGIGSGSCAGISSPVTTSGGGTNWCQTAAGHYNSAGLKSDGSLWVWGGSGNSGSLGDGTTLQRPSPVTAIGGNNTWSSICKSGLNSFGIKTDGSLWVWGRNLNYSLGDGTSIERSSPTLIMLGSSWAQITGGYCQSGGIKTDGSLWTWGAGFQGQLGNNCTLDRSSPVTTSGGGKNWCLASTGISTHFSAIKTDGTLWSWGIGTCGRLGNNSTLSVSSPVTIAGGGTTWCFVSAAWGSTAIKIDGTLWTWGSNLYGQLGDGTVVHKSSPVTTAGGGTNWCFTSASSCFSMGIKTDGTLWTWGVATDGALGDGSTVNKSSPITTTVGGTNWCFADTGCHVMALRVS